MQLGSRRPGTGSSAREWKARASQGGRLGIAATALGAACSAAAWIYMAGRPIAVDSFVAAVAGLAALLLALVAGVLTRGYYSLRYSLAEGGITITWLGIREIIPLDSLEGLYRGQRLGKRAQVEGLSWPGHYVGTARAPEFGRLKYYGTSTDPSDLLLLATAHGSYAVTPRDLNGFRSALVERLRALPEEPPEDPPAPSTVVAWPLRLSLLRDGVALGMAAVAAVVLLASFGHVASRFPNLPELMPLHFNQAGAPDLIGPPADAFRMPLIGLLILGANLVVAAAIHRGQRDAARILVAATVFVQLAMLIAVLMVVH